MGSLMGQDSRDYLDYHDIYHDIYIVRSKCIMILGREMGTEYSTLELDRTK